MTRETIRDLALGAVLIVVALLVLYALTWITDGPTREHACAPARGCIQV